MLTLKQAADAVGMSKAGLLKALRSGRLSATRDYHGRWQIDPAELFRVYQSPVTGNQLPATSLRQEAVTGAAELTVATQLAVTQTRLEAAERELALLRGQVADLREDRDAWRRQAAALTHQSDVGSAGGQPPAMGWIGRLLRL